MGAKKYTNHGIRIGLEASEILLSRATPFDLRLHTIGGEGRGGEGGGGNARRRTYITSVGAAPGTEIRAK